MLLRELIVEGYREVEAKFVAAGADAGQVKTAIQQYRDLVNRNQVQGQERNIDWWGKNHTFADFAQFLDQKALDTSKSQLKKSRDTGRSVNLLETDDWLIVVPLDKDASCFHGKNSDWCTTKREHGYFEDYFYNKSIILIYCLNKKTGGMWAIANYRHVELPDPDDEDAEDSEFDVETLERNHWAELFDQKDNSITIEQFQQQTGLDADQLLDLSDQKMAPGAEIDNRLRGRSQQMSQARKQIGAGVRQRDLDLERELIDLGDDLQAYQYAAALGKSGLDLSALPLKLQYLAARYNIKGSVLQWMTNPNRKITDISIKNQPDAISVLIDRDQMTPEMLDSISVSRFNEALVQQLMDKKLFTPELRDRLAQDSQGVYVLNKLGEPVSQSEVEASIVKRPQYAQGVMIWDILRAIKTFGFAPSTALFTQAAEALNTTTDQVKSQVLEYVNRSIEEQNHTIRTAMQRESNAKSSVKQYQSYVDEAQAEIDELTALERLSYSQQDRLRRAKTNVKMYSNFVDEYKAALGTSIKVIETAKEQIKNLEAVAEKIK